MFKFLMGLFVGLTVSAAIAHTPKPDDEGGVHIYASGFLSGYTVYKKDNPDDVYDPNIPWKVVCTNPNVWLKKDDENVKSPSGDIYCNAPD